MPTLLVLGAGGHLGQALAHVRPSHATFLTRAQLDVTNAASVAAALTTLRPDVVINAAAMADVDACEHDPIGAARINAEAPGHIARACAEIDAAFIHVSTDYVFGADAQTQPRTERDPPAPLNIYGRSKLDGEQCVAQGGGRFCIVRTAWLFGYAGDFISRMMQRSRSQLALRVTDQIGTPTPVDALAAALVRLADRLCARLETPPILHIAGSPPTSRHAWVAAALRANAMTAAADRMVMTPMDASASGAARPHSTPLDSSLFHAIFGQQIDWQSYLTRAPGSV